MIGCLSLHCLRKITDGNENAEKGSEWIKFSHDFAEKAAEGELVSNKKLFACSYPFPGNHSRPDRQNSGYNLYNYIDEPDDD